MNFWTTRGSGAPAHTSCARVVVPHSISEKLQVGFTVFHGLATMYWNQVPIESW